MSTITFQDRTVETDHAIITPTAPTRPRAFYAHLYDQSGALCQVNSVLYFVTDEGTVTEIQPNMINFLCVLGEMILSDTQRLHDKVCGGCAAIATTRPMGKS